MSESLTNKVLELVSNLVVHSSKILSQQTTHNIMRLGIHYKNIEMYDKTRSILEAYQWLIDMIYTVLLKMRLAPKPVPGPPWAYSVPGIIW